MRIEVCRNTELAEEFWYFWVRETTSFPDIMVALDAYTKATRSTRRHGFTTRAHWSRLMRRDSTIAFEEVPKPDDVLLEAENTTRELVRAAWSFEHLPKR